MPETSLFERHQPLMIILAATAGLALGQIPAAVAVAPGLIVPLLIVMLLGSFLQVPLGDLGRAFADIRFFAASMAVNFGWNPVLAWALGALLLGNSPDLRVGLIMLLVTPCTDWYLVFTSVAGGNVALGMAVLPWKLVIQLVLLPVYLLILGGTLVEIDHLLLLRSMMWVLAVPLGLSLILRGVASRAGRSEWFDRQVKDRAGAAQILFLCLAVAAMFASQGTLILRQPAVIARVMVPVLAFFAINYQVTRAVAHRLGLPGPAVAAFVFATVARNSPLALAIAAAAFPDRPLISLALVIGPLVELPVLALMSHCLRVAQVPNDAKRT